MNAERLHAILKALQSEIASSKSVGILGNLVSALENQVKAPQEPNHQQGVAEQLKSLRGRLQKVASNSFSPAWKLVVSEIGGEPVLGEVLLARLDEIFARNQITVSVALEEVRVLHDAHKAFFEAVGKALDALKHFGIGSETLSPGDAEVGILIPRVAVANSLEKLGREFEELDRIFNVFSEIAARERPPLQVRSISSSEFQIFLDSVSPVAACIAFSIERVVALYERLLNIRALRQKLQEEQVPEEKLAGVTEHANDFMNRSIDELAEEVLIKFHEGADAARSNELRIELKISLKRLASRVDRGYNIEVRAEPVPDAETEEGASQDPYRTQQQEHVRIIQEAAVRLRYRKLEGEPILSLPETDRDREA